MASPSISPSSQPKIVGSIVEAGKKAFDPATDVDSREAGLREYNELLER